MKFRCETKVLADSLALVGSVVPARSPKPVLENIKLVASASGGLELMATDREVGLRCAGGGLAEGEVEAPGEVLRPAAQASNIAREATTKDISVATEESKCIISYTGASYDFPCDNSADFPEMPGFSDKKAVTVAAGELKTMIARTVFAAAQEQARYALNGILFSLKGEVLRLVATDGRRLALVKGKAINKGGVAAEPIIPTKAMALLEKLMVNPEEKVKVEMGDTQVVVQTAAATLSTRLIEGQFPNYEEVLPKDCDKTMTVPTAKLHSAIRRTALITAGESRSVRFSIKKDALLLSSLSLEGRHAAVEAEGAKYDAEPLDIAFNPDFFTDMLKVVGDEEVTVSFKDSTSAALVKAGKDYTYVVMPVQLQET